MSAFHRLSKMNNAPLKGMVFLFISDPKWLGPLKVFLEIFHFCKVGIIFWQQNLRADSNFSGCVSLTFWKFAPCYGRWDKQHNINLIFQGRSKHLKACEGWMTQSQICNTTQRFISYFQLHLWSKLRRYLVFDLLVWGWTDSKRGIEVLQHSIWKVLQGPDCCSRRGWTWHIFTLLTVPVAVLWPGL